MSDRSEQSRDPAEWFEIADGDLRVARLCLAAEPPELRAVCFHAQQAAEKHLKGYLVSRTVGFPRTHDLRLILRLCADQDPAFEGVREQAVELEGLAVGPRYPFPQFLPTRDEAQEAVSAAEHIAAFVREHVRL